MPEGSLPFEGKRIAVGPVGDPSSSLALDPDMMLARFLEHVEVLKRAAAEWGLRPEWPEAVYLSSMISTQVGFAEMAVQLSRRVEGVVGDARAVSEAELERMRVATVGTQRAMEAAKAATENLKSGSQIALAKFEADKHKVTTDFVKNLVPEIVIGLKSAIALRQHHYNRDKEWGRALGTAGVMLGLLVGGFVAGITADSGRGLRYEQMQAAVERCQSSSPWKDDKGERLCGISAFLRK